jgi:hypothetical protein
VGLGLTLDLQLPGFDLEQFATVQGQIYPQPNAGEEAGHRCCSFRADEVLKRPGELRRATIDPG